MSVDEILAVIRSHPEVVAEALERRPELLTSLILKLAPWDRFATKEDIKMLLDFIGKRFETIDKRFEDMNRRFETIDKRFEDMNKRFETIDKRFEDLMRYVDKRVGLVEKLLIGFNVPILIAVITMLMKLILF